MDKLLKGLKALAHETRLRLIHILLTQDLCGRALSGRLGISEAAVSQHMKILKEAGLVAGMGGVIVSQPVVRLTTD